MEPKVVNHYGKWINSEEPTTGVLGINSAPSWVYDEPAIDLGCLECESRQPATLEEPDSCDGCESTGPHLIGKWKKDSAGLYEPDKTGEYSAIMREDIIQVVWSIKTQRGALCSPCNPGQVDLDSAGEFLGYCLPNPAEGWDFGGGVDDPRY
jgi:hypothetical protein